MAGRGRPRFEPTTKQRDRVRRLKADGWPNERIARVLGISRNTLETAFAEEIEFGLDLKLDETLELAEKGAKKGNATLIKWLAQRRDLARAQQQVAERGEAGASLESRPVAKGKKEQAQAAADEVTGIFAVPQGPTVKPH
ncbi:MAG: hypothetical protein ACK4JB_19925 [Reyranella sp.]